MDFKNLPPEIRAIWRVVKVVQMVMGFSLGLYLFTYGPYLYDSFGGKSDPKTAMLLTSVWLAVQNILIALLEVPTGAIGDAIGRKKTVLWSLICRVGFFTFLALVNITTNTLLSFTLALIAAVSFAFAYTFYSGSFTAWWVDNLRQKAPDLGYEHFAARGYTLRFVSGILGSVLGIFCYTNDITYAAFLLAAFVCIPCFTLCSAEMEEEYTQFLTSKKVNFAIITKRIGEIIGLGFQTFKRSKPILCLTLLFASFMFLVNIVDYLWPVALEAHTPASTRSYYWIGLVVMLFSMKSFGSQTVARLSKNWAHKRNNLKTHNKTLISWLVTACLSCGIPVMAMGILMSVWGKMEFPLFVMAIVLVSMTSGIMFPCFETLVNNYIPEASSNERATILSFGSLLRSVLVTLLAVPAGGGSAETTTAGWMIPAFLVVLMSIITYIVLTRKEKETEATPETEPVGKTE